MKTFYEKDADVNLIKNKKVAIFGYGSQGVLNTVIGRIHHRYSHHGNAWGLWNNITR